MARLAIRITRPQIWCTISPATINFKPQSAHYQFSTNHQKLKKLLAVLSEPIFHGPARRPLTNLTTQELPVPPRGYPGTRVPATRVPGYWHYASAGPRAKSDDPLRHPGHCVTALG
eukprot:140238-Rhodomonas_salina.2